MSISNEPTWTANGDGGRNSRGNCFSLGTPFVEGNSGFLTPLRPRTLRTAVAVAC